MKNLYSKEVGMSSKKAKVDPELVKRLIKVVDDSCSGNRSDFAAALGIAPSNITRYLSGTTVPKISFLAMVSDIYGYNYLWLAKGVGPVKGTSPDEYKRLHSQCSKLAKENEELRKTVNNLNDMLELYKTKHKGK
jgi:transcriptional regulator with XRE-family HTH domain